MTAGSGMKNIIALIPNVEEWEAACAEEVSLDVLFRRKPAHGRFEARQCTHIERKREAQRVISLLTKRQQLQMDNNLCKRLQSHFI